MPVAGLVAVGLTPSLAGVRPRPRHGRHRERQEYVALTILTMYLISGALRTKAPLPFYMPDTLLSIRRLVHALRDHTKIDQHERLPQVYYLATVSAMEEVRQARGRAPLGRIGARLISALPRAARQVHIPPTR